MLLMKANNKHNSFILKPITFTGLRNITQKYIKTMVSERQLNILTSIVTKYLIGVVAAILSGFVDSFVQLGVPYEFLI